MWTIISKILLVLYFLLFFTSWSKAQDSISSKNRSFIALPFVYYTPESGWAFGAGTGYYFRSDTFQSTKYSQVMAGIAYTTMNQALFYITPSIFLKRNKAFINGELGYYRYSYYFHGLGNRANGHDMYEVDFPRLRVNYLFRLKENQFLGPGLYLENYNMIRVPEMTLLDTGNIPGSRGSTVALASLNYSLDSRDNTLFPEKGDRVYLQAESGPKLGKRGFDFSRYRFYWTHYYSPAEDAVLAAQLRTEGLFGTAPFQQLILIGGDQELKGYYKGRYRGKQMLGAQVEWRQIVYKRFGYALYSGMALLGEKAFQLDFSKWMPSFGCGLRYRVLSNQKLNIRLDYAHGITGGQFYLGFGETF